MLQLKLQTQVSDDRTQIQIKDITGDYDATSNPGGWGGSNYVKNPTGVHLIRYQVANQTTSKWLNLTGTFRAADLVAGNFIALTGEDFGLPAGSVFGNGEYFIEWLVLYAYVTPADNTQIATVDTSGTKVITKSPSSVVTDLRLAVNPRGGIYRVDLAVPLYLVDMSQPITATQAYLQEAYDSDVTGVVLSIVNSVSVSVMVVDDINQCVMTAIAGVAKADDCGCNGSEIDDVVYMTILKFGMDVNQACGNLQGAANIRSALGLLCNCKCDC